MVLLALVVGVAAPAEGPAVAAAPATGPTTVVAAASAMGPAMETVAAMGSEGNAVLNRALMFAPRDSRKYWGCSLGTCRGRCSSRASSSVSSWTTSKPTYVQQFLININLTLFQFKIDNFKKGLKVK